MAVTKDIIEFENSKDNPDISSIKRYRELKSKKKRELLRKLREDRIKRNSSVVHEI